MGIETSFSKPSEARRQQWSTPWPAFLEIERRYAYGGEFDIDVAASDGNAKCDQYITEAEDAFEVPWEGRCFCNPPWSDILRWVLRADEQVEYGNAEQVVMLVPSRTATEWFMQAMRRAHPVFIRGRVNYDPPPGVEASSAGEGSLIFIFERPIVMSRLTASV